MRGKYENSDERSKQCDNEDTTSRHVLRSAQIGRFVGYPALITDQIYNILKCCVAALGKEHHGDRKKENNPFSAGDVEETPKQDHGPGGDEVESHVALIGGQEDSTSSKYEASEKFSHPLMIQYLSALGL